MTNNIVIFPPRERGQPISLDLDRLMFMSMGELRRRLQELPQSSDMALTATAFRIVSRALLLGEVGATGRRNELAGLSTSAACAQGVMLLELADELAPPGRSSVVDALYAWARAAMEQHRFHGMMPNEARLFAGRLLEAAALLDPAAAADAIGGA